MFPKRRNNINLYNHGHNGDLFYSRMIFKPLISRGYQIKFNHNNNPKIFEDCPTLHNGSLDLEIHNPLGNDNVDKKIFNMWIGKMSGNYYGIGGPYYEEIEGCTFLTHKKICEDILKKLQITNIPDIDYLPTINFLRLNITSDLNEKISQGKCNYEKLILVCNGDCLSGQAINFDFSPIILKLSKIFPNYLFLTTKLIESEFVNIINISDWTKLKYDLLYISYISKFCNVIIGRASGPHCFTHIKENLLDVEKTFISFTKRETEGKWYMESICNQIWSDSNDTKEIFNIISSNI
jgi:hypothetical protein